MSYIINNLWESNYDFSPVDALIYSNISSWCKSSSGCYESIETMAKKSFCNRKTAERSIKKLLDAKIIKKGKFNPSTKTYCYFISDNLTYIRQNVLQTECPTSDNLTEGIGQSDQPGQTICPITTDNLSYNNNIYNNNDNNIYNKDKDNKDNIINNITEKPIDEPIVKPVKKRKEKKPIVYADTDKVYCPLDEKLNDTVIEYIEYRAEIHKPITERSINAMLKTLSSATSNTDLHIEWINKSIAMGWQGVFVPKDFENNSKGKNNNGTEDYNATVNRMYREECEKNGNNQHQGLFSIGQST